MFFFLNHNEGWAIGGEGIILHTVDGGRNWRPQWSETRHNLNAIYMTDAENGWIVGDRGVILKYTVVNMGK